MGTQQPQDSAFIGYDQHEDNFPETTKTSFVYGVEISRVAIKARLRQYLHSFAPSASPSGFLAVAHLQLRPLKGQEES